MARKFTKWGGVRINTNKTPQQFVDQLNRIERGSFRNSTSKDSWERTLDLNLNVGNSTATKRYGIEYNRGTGMFSLNRKGRMNSNTPIAAMGGTGG